MWAAYRYIIQKQLIYTGRKLLKQAKEGQEQDSTMFIISYFHFKFEIISKLYSIKALKKQK